MAQSSKLVYLPFFCTPCISCVVQAFQLSSQVSFLLLLQLDAPLDYLWYPKLSSHSKIGMDSIPKNFKFSACSSICSVEDSH